MDTVKWVSSVASYLLRNRKKTVYMSLTKLKNSSYSVYMGFKCTGCVYVLLGISFNSLKKSGSSLYGKGSGPLL